MRIKKFDESKGDYFIGRYVEYWKSGDYFHKKVFFARCFYDNVNSRYFILSKDGSCEWNLKYLGHNVEVIGLSSP